MTFSNQQLLRLVNEHEIAATRWRRHGETLPEEWPERKQRYYTTKIKLYIALRLRVPLSWWKWAEPDLVWKVYGKGAKVL